MKSIKYVGYYDSLKNQSENRSHVLSASNKMTYISVAINKAGYPVEIISVSPSLNNAVCAQKTIALANGITLKLPFCLGNGSKLKRLVDRFIIRLQLLNELILKTKKSQPVIVYHSLGYMKTIQFAKAIRKFNLILEVEELYGDVIHSEKTIHKELRFFHRADAYIFPVTLLNEKINRKEKPYAIIHGTYQVEAERNCKLKDEKIHAVYAGTFDPRKGGGAAAAAAAAYLNSRYHIHIIGFGSEKDKKNMQQLIAEISKTTDCTLTYDGLFSGEDYIRFLQSCHIGLSTQNPNAPFNDTSFPSKVLSYLANGLRVISIRIKALECSSIHDLIYYYEEDTPESIARAIQRIDISKPYDSRGAILKLDRVFCADIKKLIEKLES